jgi:hypothetical protein
VRDWHPEGATSGSVNSVVSCRVLGMIQARRGNKEQARETLEEGLQRARAIPFPHGEARLLEAYALLDRQCGDAASADTRLADALAIFERPGARRDSERLRPARTRHQLGSRAPGGRFHGDHGPPGTRDRGVGAHPPTQRGHSPVAIRERTQVVCQVPLTLDLAVG